MIAADHLQHNQIELVQVNWERLNVYTVSLHGANAFWCTKVYHLNLNLEFNMQQSHFATHYFGNLKSHMTHFFDRFKISSSFSFDSDYQYTLVHSETKCTIMILGNVDLVLFPGN